MNKCELFTTQETMAYLGISRTRLHTLGKKGLLRPREGLTRGNVYLKSEIDSLLAGLPVKEDYLTAEEVKTRMKSSYIR